MSSITTTAISVIFWVTVGLLLAAIVFLVLVGVTGSEIIKVSSPVHLSAPAAVEE